MKNIFLLALLIFNISLIAQNRTNVIYVNKNVVGSSGSGDNWINAYSELSDALLRAKSDSTIGQIWVAKGIYKPLYNAEDGTSGDGGRKNSFVLIDSVKIYGGFLGVEINLYERDWLLNPTVLSGDFNDDDGALFTNMAENAAHVIIAAGKINNAVLDGFTIKGGNTENADNIVVNGCYIGLEGAGINNTGASPNYNNLIITENIAIIGGGISNIRLDDAFVWKCPGSIEDMDPEDPGFWDCLDIIELKASPVFYNVKVTNNSTWNSSGGGIANLNGAELTMINSIISNNSTRVEGGGIMNWDMSDLILINTLIYGNKAGSTGGGITNNGANSMLLVNVTVANNYCESTYSGSEIHNGYIISSYNIQNSIIWGNDGVLSTSNLDVNYIYNSLVKDVTTINVNNNVDGTLNPMFVNILENNYNLQNISPLIDRGNNSYVNNSYMDIDNKYRIINNIVDLGAYEFSPCLIPDANGVIYINKNVLTSGDGSSWDKAVKELADALVYIQNCNNGIKEIWVANNTYYPMYKVIDFDENYVETTDRDRAFLIPKNIKIYGGFSGNESNLVQRDSLSYNTILSGYISEGLSCYHVVIAVGNIGTSCLNGFLIRQGTADGGASVILNKKLVPQYKGGGIINIDTENSDITYANLRITLNKASQNGGGVFSSSSDLKFNNSIITLNIVDTGKGGGIYNNTSKSLFSDCQIISNTANQGGGVYNYNSSIIMNRVKISNNIAIKAAGVYNHVGGTIEYINCLINDNNASTDGGGVYNENVSCKLLNSTITGNKAASGSGGGIYQGNYAISNIDNTIVWDNNDKEIYVYPSNEPMYRYSIIKGIDLSTFEGSFDGTSNPLFVDPANKNYDLQLESPLINKGNSNLYIESTSSINNNFNLDLNYANRIIRGNIDLGAYENQDTTCLFNPNNEGVLFVDNNVLTSGDGSSWENAAKELADVIYAIQYCNIKNIKEIWVVQGTYFPIYKAAGQNTVGTATTDRDKSFVLPANVKIYGGFVGNESQLSERNWKTNVTILSGDIGTVSVSSDNCFHVVLAIGNLGTTILDGFTINGGNANGSGGIITVSSIMVESARGGGIYIAHTDRTFKNVIINNVIVQSNSARDNGGGIYVKTAGPMLSNLKILNNICTKGNGGGINNATSNTILTNVLIAKNQANGGVSGGGVFNQNLSGAATPIFTNVTIANNTALSGGGMFSQTSCSVRNSIFYGNNAPSFPNVGGTTPNYFFSLVQGALISGGIILNQDPLFNNTTNNDFSLSICSPAINSGNNMYFQTGQNPDLSNIVSDVDGNVRNYNENIIDLGAYEFQSDAVYLVPNVDGIIYVNKNAVSNGNGSSWENATKEFADALLFAKNCGNVNEIWVAEGLYNPLYRASLTDQEGSPTTERDKAFVLPENIKIYGGFNGTENSISQRDWKIYQTILSGNIGDESDNGDNCYHIILSVGDVGNTIFDGFYIQDGNADGASSINVNNENIFQNQGGGIYILNSSPKLSNLVVNLNMAYVGGGIYTSNGRPFLNKVKVIDNTSMFNGGGIYFNASKSTVVNTLIANNVTYGFGGGICFDGTTDSIINVTIASNYAEQYGDGAAYIASGNPVIINSIIWWILGSTIIEINGSSPTYYNSIIQEYNLGEQNFDGTDPTYEPNFDSEYVQTSGIIDIGNNSLYNINYYGNEDLAGNKRINKKIDLGAYEFNCPSEPFVEFLPMNENVCYDNSVSLPIKISGISIAAPYKVKYSINDGNNLQEKEISILYNNYNIIEEPIFGETTYKLISITDANGCINDTINDSITIKPFSILPDVNGVLYVDNRVDVSGDGSSWTTAIKELADALHFIRICNIMTVKEIWVAQGTYYPIYKIAEFDEMSDTTTNRDKSFILPKNVKIYGGFGGGETSLSQRDWFFNQTILSGDLNKDDDWSDWGNFNVSNSENNSNHVVISVGEVDNTCLDGFTIMHGVASNRNSFSNYNSINLNGQLITKEDGAAIYCKYSSPIFNNLTIINNLAISEQRMAGGAIYFEGTSALLKNSIIKNNYSMIGGGIFCKNDESKFVNTLIAENLAIDGGGLYTEWSYHEFISTTIANNTSNNNGGGLYFSSNSSFVVQNSIFGNNQAYVDGQDIYANGLVSYSAEYTLITNPNMIQEEFYGYEIILNQSPEFDIDYSLKETSPAVNSGNKDLYNLNEYGAYDLYGNKRILYNQIDRGAIEYKKCVIPDFQGIVYVNKEVLISGDGSNWENAVKEFSDVLVSIYNCSVDVKEIWVAQGTYYPLYKIADLDANQFETTDRNKSFLLPPDVKIYGGFIGQETNLNQRNWNENITILSGDIGDIGVSDDNSFHVVVAVGDLGSTVLDGFTIQDGFATGTMNIIFDGESIYQGEGAGIISIKTSILYSNLIVSSNLASSNGGGICKRNDNSIFNRLVIRDNFSLASGGGVYSIFSTSHFVNSLVISNFAGYQGGGFTIDGASDIFINITVADNSSSPGAGVSAIAGSNLKLVNTIIWGNDLDINSSSLDYKYSIIQGVDLSSYEGCFDGTSVDNDPSFSFDYSLIESSPLINMGENSYYDTEKYGNTDIINGERISEGKIDLGAFEKQGDPLPVDLVSFSVTCKNDIPLITWQTASEINNDYFIIERSSNLEHFYEIAKIDGAGNSNTIISYVYLDNNYKVEDMYYRLKQVDFDGKERIYNVVFANCVNDSVVIEVYPNPVENKLHVNLKNWKDDKVTMEILNSSGQVIYRKDVSVSNPNYHIKIKMEEYKPGMYYLYIMSNNKKYTKKIIKS